MLRAESIRNENNNNFNNNNSANEKNNKNTSDQNKNVSHNNEYIKSVKKNEKRSNKKTDVFLKKDRKYKSVIFRSHGDISAIKNYPQFSEKKITGPMSMLWHSICDTEHQEDSK